MEAKSETNKPISNFLFILWAGGTALLSYSLVYALRKPLRLPLLTEWTFSEWITK